MISGQFTLWCLLKCLNHDLFSVWLPEWQNKYVVEWQCIHAEAPAARMFTDSALVGFIETHWKVRQLGRAHTRTHARSLTQHTLLQSKCPKHNVTKLIAATVLALRSACVRARACFVWQTGRPSALTQTIGSLSHPITVHVRLVVPESWLHVCQWLQEPV